jgi:DNA-binding LytR/AlgR family response regulator
MAKDNKLGSLLLRCEYNQISIPFETIMYIESNKDYVTVHTPREKIVCTTPLRLLLYELPQSLFIQSHRNYVVAISQIEALEPSRITLINKEKVPLSKSYRKPLIDTLMEMGVIDRGF